ncbi:hypothetical protein B0J13DRAFT_535443 [Dactylonectria estremocensis]|uniref:Secreted protein n=1 Tax=Dactylonectria estremocensis TaxID=1079267 RepID=A0A9P9FJI4_9HYPO|nr:hypothetical protein B0J13DRAFT_535443 [Dactylonectria estremocensis]
MFFCHGPCFHFLFMPFLRLVCLVSDPEARSDAIGYMWLNECRICSSLEMLWKLDGTVTSQPPIINRFRHQTLGVSLCFELAQVSLPRRDDPSM